MAPLHVCKIKIFLISKSVSSLKFFVLLNSVAIVLLKKPSLNNFNKKQRSHCNHIGMSPGI